jgi:hypothetical protein
MVRPAIDRVYVAMRGAARPRTRELVERTGLRPGFVSDFYFGLLARPMPADAFAAATIYRGGDMTGALEQDLATADESGAWRLTDRGRGLASQVQQAVAGSAEEFWNQPAGGTMPWSDRPPRLAQLLGRLLQAGAATGGPAFHAMAPVFEPEGASPALQVSSRMGALRHHRADAHRAAWTSAGLDVAELLALQPDDPRRGAIEEETNRLDSPIYDAFTGEERLEFLALLASLPG